VYISLERRNELDTMEDVLLALGVGKTACAGRGWVIG
jgi:hypothetical protein